MPSPTYIYYYTIFLLISFVSHCITLDAYDGKKMEYVVPFAGEPEKIEAGIDTGIKNSSIDELWSGYQNRNECNHRFARLSVCSGSELIENFNNNLLYKKYWILFNYKGPIHICLGLCLNFSKEKKLNQYFTIKKINFRFGIQPNGSYKLSLDGGFGNHTIRDKQNKFDHSPVRTYSAIGYVLASYV